MSDKWTASSAGLPHEGEPIEFVLDGREIAMNGTYARRVFRSHWSEYEIDRVCTWRTDDAHPIVSVVTPTPDGVAFA